MAEHTTTTEANRRHWLATASPKAAPAIATSTVLILARIWNANGAQHSIGDAALMGVLATGAAVAGGLAAAGRNGDPAVTGAAFTASGALAVAGVAGYADGLPLPLLLWAIATVLSYALAARYWREDRRESVAYDRHTIERRETQRHVETVEVIRARASVETARVQIDVARESTAYATALVAAITARNELPGFNPDALIGDGLPELPATVITAKEH
ncbi:hypothetical protein [Actinacidiphila oryziradicis]|uniref:Uncharacterized protein n=1 Tax=Actinacidiphila oryziradicis TaxID=2571141 RepID=A0A4U0RVZ1_9ACTN|nr:hypothetical protein [Actinacidiphila oryziradicis]TJZ99696.1 hypothetical protein FCI23_44725 [Actinacidiphila oryziradicis]